VKKERSGYIKAGGKNLFYQILHEEWLSADKPLLVFLHEGLGSVAQWKDFPNSLAFHVKCPALLYDRYGYGKSEALSEPRYTRYLHDEALVTLPELFRNLGFEHLRKILVGHSDGATIALMHAGAFPGKIAGIVSEAAHVLVEPATISGILEVRALMKTARFRELLERYHGEKTAFTANSWVENWLSEESMTWNVEEYLPGITCPVLAVQGTEDQFGSEAQLDSIRKNISGPAEILLIPGCGHIPHKQARDLVLKKMSEFIFMI
jgi:pimeloyl-ACP methyl ester carboxylesterase